MFSKLLVAVGAAVAAVTLVFAAGDITITECKDKECKTDCRAVGKIAQGTCNTDHFRKGHSFKATCGPAPNQMCVYAAIFSKNATAPCGDYNVMGLEDRECDTCFQNHMKEWMKISGCRGSGNLTLSVDCDATCATCKHTVSIKEKTCNSFPHLKFDVGYSVPAKCKGTIAVEHFENDDCSGTGMKETNFADSCYGFGGPGGRGRSNYYHCSN